MTKARWVWRTVVSAVGATAVFLASGPAAFAGSACGGPVCLTVDNSGRYVARATATPAKGGDFFGYFELHGPPGLQGKSASRHWRAGQKYGMALGRVVPDRTKICVDSWKTAEYSKDVKPEHYGHVCVEVRGQ
ncbi:hypothetical protein ACWD4B_02550 [Streptomyces sp. NPDC002536]